MSLFAAISGAPERLSEAVGIDGGLVNLMWVGLFITFCLFCVWQFYRHEVRPYRNVRQCSCHPRRPRGGKVIGSYLPTKRPHWRA